MNRRKFLFGVPVAAAAVVVAKKLPAVEPKLFMAEYRHRGVRVFATGSETEEFYKRLTAAQARLKCSLEDAMYYADGPCAYYSGYDLLK